MMNVLKGHSYCAHRSGFNMFNLTFPILNDNGAYQCEGESKSCMTDESLLGANHYCYPNTMLECPIVGMSFAETNIDPIEKPLNTDQSVGTPMINLQA